MYTLRDATAADFQGTFEKVAKIGYHGVEFAGFGGLNATQIRKMLDGLGLKCAGAHEGVEHLQNDFNAVVDFHTEIGSKFVTIPSLPEELRKDEAGWKKTAGMLDELGAKYREKGLQLSYHNHAFEFTKYGEQYGLDLLYANAAPENLHAEIDTYWVKYGGEDPVAYLKRYSNRLSLVHLKDMAGTPEREYCEIGEGILDIPGLFKAAEGAGTKWMIVEQDTCKRPPLESVKLSFENMKKLGFA